MAKKRGLGRSLEALLTKPTALTEENSTLDSPEISLNGTSKEGFKQLAISHIQPGKFQPRRQMNPDTLQELSESIRAQGIIQPIVIRRLPNSDKYEIIAGERRWRAAGMAGLSEVPVVIRDLPDETVMAMALIENIQREDLNAIEEAQAMERLIKECEMTHQQLAEALGKSRTAITNALRLLALAPEVRSLLENGQLEMGHGRALLGLATDKQPEAARRIMNLGLSVRQAEQLVRHLHEPRGKADHKPMEPDLKQMQDNLSRRLGLRVSIQSNASGKGKIVIHYRNLREFDNLMDLLPEKMS